MAGKKEKAPVKLKAVKSQDAVEGERDIIDEALRHADENQRSTSRGVIGNMKNELHEVPQPEYAKPAQQKRPREKKRAA